MVASIQIMNDTIDGLGVLALAYNRQNLANYLKRYKLRQRYASTDGAFVNDWDAEVIVRYSDGSAIGF